MNNMLETLRDVLLVFTVILLVYVLYKRLLRVLGKPDIQKKYPSLGERIHWKDDRHAELEVKLEEPTFLHVEVFSASGSKLIDAGSDNYKTGKVMIPIDCSALDPGRYYFRVTSPLQQASQYFVLT